MSTVRMTIRVDKKLRSQLSKLAKQRGETESELAHVALQSYLDATPPQESCYDIAKRLGIIGIMKDGPSDLSTNPKHLEGFGRD